MHGVWGLRRCLPGQLFYDDRREEPASPIVLLLRLRYLPGNLSLRGHYHKHRLGRPTGRPIKLSGPCPGLSAGWCLYSSGKITALSNKLSAISFIKIFVVRRRFNVLQSFSLLNPIFRFFFSGVSISLYMASNTTENCSSYFFSIILILRAHMRKFEVKQSQYLVLLIPLSLRFSICTESYR